MDAVVVQVGGGDINKIGGAGVQGIGDVGDDDHEGVESVAAVEADCVDGAAEGQGQLVRVGVELAGGSDGEVVAIGPGAGGPGAEVEQEGPKVALGRTAADDLRVFDGEG